MRETGVSAVEGERTVVGDGVSAIDDGVVRVGEGMIATGEEGEAGVLEWEVRDE